MQSAFRIQAKVLPGKRLEIHLPDNSAVGDTVDVFIVFPEHRTAPQRSVLDILSEIEGQRLFQSPEEADRYLQAERDSWDR